MDNNKSGKESPTLVRKNKKALKKEKKMQEARRKRELKEAKKQARLADKQKKKERRKSKKSSKSKANENEFDSSIHTKSEPNAEDLSVYTPENDMTSNLQSKTTGTVTNPISKRLFYFKTNI